MGRRRLKGDRSFKRILQQLPQAITTEVEQRLDAFGEEMAAVQRSSGLFRNRSGSLRAGITYKVLKSLKVKIGILGKPLNKRLFYGLMIEFGRKGGGRGVKRGSMKYAAGVGKTRPDHFIYGHAREQEAFKREFNEFWNRVLERVAHGVSDD